MKIGLISDIHANLPALKSVFESGKVENIEHWFCLGDIVSYYYWPSECIKLLSEHSIDCISGNHDRVLCDMAKNDSYFDDYSRKYGSGNNLALNVLSKFQLNWLCSLPEKLELSIDGKKVMLCHGSPWDRDYYVYPDADNKVRQRMKKTDCDLIFFGHTHYPVIWHELDVIVVNPGSVGQPRDSKPGACWAIWDTETNNINLKRESYNYEIVIEACRKYDPDNSYLQNILTRRN